MQRSELQQLFCDYAASFNTIVNVLQSVKNSEDASQRRKSMSTFKKEQKIAQEILKKIKKGCTSA